MLIDFGSSFSTVNQSFPNLTVTRNHASLYLPHFSHGIFTWNSYLLTTLDWTCPVQCRILSISPPQGQNIKLKSHKVDQELTAASFSTPLRHALLTGYMRCTIPQRGILGIPHVPAYVGAASVHGGGLANIVAQGALYHYTLWFFLFLLLYS